METFAIGLLIGYLIITISESFFHRYIQHAPKNIRSMHKHLWTLGSSLRLAWYSHHVIHHYKTFHPAFTVQFRTVEEKERLDRHLSDQNMGEIIEADYGARIGSKAKYYIMYVLPTLPIFTLACFIGGIVFSLGALVPMIIWPMLAEFVHPYLHMNYKDIRTKAPFYAKVMSKTPYFKWLAIHHWMHHRYERCNYNLLLGGDVILGVQRFPAGSDWKDIKKAGLWTPGGTEQNHKPVHHNHA